MSYRFKSASCEFLKEALSPERVAAGLERAQAQGASPQRMAAFAQRQGQVTDKHLAAAYAPGTTPQQYAQHLQRVDRASTAESLGMAHVMGQQVAPNNPNTARLNAAHAARTPAPVAPAPAAPAPGGVGRYLPKSNWGRAGLAVGAAGLAYGGYRMMSQQPQQPQQPLYR